MKSRYFSCLLVLCLSFNACKEPDRISKKKPKGGFDSQAHQEFSDARKQLRDDAQRELDENGEISFEYEKEIQRKMLEAAKKMEQETEGVHGAIASVQREFLELIVEKGKPIQDHVEPLMEALDFSKLKSIDDIDKSILVLEKNKKLNKEFMDFFENELYTHLDKLLDRYNVKGKPRREFQAGSRRGLGAKKETLR